MYVCICKQVTDHEIREAVEEGEITCPHDLAKLNVAQCCGKCKPLAEEIAADQFCNPI